MRLLLVGACGAVEGVQAACDCQRIGMPKNSSGNTLGGETICLDGAIRLAPK